MRFGASATKYLYPRAVPHGADSWGVESEVDKLEGGGEAGASTQKLRWSAAAQSCVKHLYPIDQLTICCTRGQTLLVVPSSQSFASNVAGKFTPPL